MAIKRLSGLFSPPKTHFQILSDLYLNNESQYLTFHIPPTAPYLILGGNIGCLIDYEAYLSFLIRRCNLYDHVFLVLGSLEFHGLSLKQGLELAAKMQQEDRVKDKLVVLDRTRFDIPGTNVTLLGCTLWSYIPEVAEPAVLRKITEFDKSNGIKDWDIAAHNASHAADLAWLRQQVKTSQMFAGSSTSDHTGNYLVVTAFAPDLRNALTPWQVDSPWSSAYGTDLLKGDWEGVKVWVCGSTGRTTMFKKDGIKVIINQRGLAGEEDKGILRDGLGEKEKRGLFDVTRIVKV
ncbi:hypothetical protein CC78DRAFT_535002 [Lojkania enalia]|uniref:Uncharacterized protein n=1 Tax=Lojkania enalia TaxID=147567 RepID=A0A9P4K3G0_9PLEO|nr:hypothetical protein CC78DRAFT_535002 [Didymosphaeria enalia]